MTKIGDVIAGRFRIDAMIGEGGMGAVYRASQLNLNRPVAIKMMHPEYAARPASRARFVREAKVASKLHHPNATEVYDFGEDDGRLYIAMQFLDGHSLRSIVDEDLPPVSLAETLRIVGAVADVLVSAHGMGLVHRDLKPENIFLEETPEGEVRPMVVDFGLAFIEDSDDAGRLTREGVVTGTPDYVSPEQARGVGVGPASDIYSLGCVMYEMLTSAVPFHGEAALVLARHLFLEPTSMREAAPDAGIPAVVDEFVLRMLSKSAEARPNAKAVRDRVLNIDPAESERKGIGRFDGQLLGREARMVSERPSAPLSPAISSSAEQQIHVALHGSVEEIFLLGLSANGIRLHPADNLVDGEVRGEVTPRSTSLDGQEHVQVRLVVEASDQEIAALCQGPIPVVVAADSADVKRLSELLRLGVSEVVIRPLSPETVAKKVQRAKRSYRHS